MQRLSQPHDVQILVVDDEPVVRDLIARWLRDAGYVCATTDSAPGALELLHQQTFDLVTLDITMPGSSGLDVLDQIKEQYVDTAVLMLTAEGDSSKAIRALTAGAFGYLIKPIERQELLIQIRNGLERRQLVIESREHTLELEIKVREQTQTIRTAHEETIHRLIKASLCRDEETGAHIKRTGWYSELMATALGWKADQVELIRLAAPMHDIGKIGIPDAVLRKPDKLTSEEFEVMKTHTQIGAKMLEGSQSPVLRMAQEIALCHHERWDGDGYPNGLKGLDIPESARILAIVDVFDALSHDRVYHFALSESEVVAKLREGRGSHFDPRLLDTFLSLLPEMRAIAIAVSNEEETDAIEHAPSIECPPAQFAFTA